MHLKRPKILVIGDLMLDHYVFGSCARISPEAPVQIVDVTREESRLGGACNVAHNLIALGAKVEICGVVGEDPNAQKLISLAQEKGIGTDLVVSIASKPTTQKSRILVSSQQILRIDYEKSDPLEDDFLESLLNSIARRIGEFDALIASDYHKGVLSEKMMRNLIALSHTHGKPILCDPKGNDYSKYKGATLLTPNKREAFEATGIDIKDSDSLFCALKKLKEQYDLTYSVITLSEDGIGMLDESMEVLPTQAQEVYDVTGAGDTVISALAFALSQGRDIRESCRFANIAAAIVVGKVGSATASLDEILSFQKNHKKTSKILSVGELPRSGNIIFTNGCFDILHRGHVQYLQEAKALGGLLVVGLNSDFSVRILKGANRPINSQEDRAYLLASLECVDYVVIFDEPTPYELIKKISPKILVKGGDYKDKEIVGSEFAQEVRLLDFLDGRSTTRIVEKIQKKQIKDKRKNI